jgi:hypothetical protein
MLLHVLAIKAMASEVLIQMAAMFKANWDGMQGMQCNAGDLTLASSLRAP